MFELYLKLLPIFFIVLILKTLADRATRRRPSTAKWFEFKPTHYNQNQITQQTPIEKLPYLKKAYLLTRTEKEFYDVLAEITQGHFLLFSKVRMADLFLLPSMNNSEYYHYFGKIKSKHVDFLLCSKDCVEPLLAIELDDSSHAREDRIARDIFVDKLFEEAHLPILHIRVASSYNGRVLFDQIRTAIFHQP